MYVTGFTKTNQNVTRTEIHAIILMITHALSRCISYMAIDGQICFHKWLFANLVKPHSCITGPVGPLGSTNQNWLCARLLPMAVLIYPGVCLHSCHLKGSQHHCLWPNGRKGLPLAFPPTPTTLPPPSTCPCIPL